MAERGNGGHPLPPVPRVLRLPPSAARLVRSAPAVPSASAVLLQLLHNAIDAGAQEIHCTWQPGSWTLSVVDDGVGIGREGMKKLATASGMTSKADHHHHKNNHRDHHDGGLPGHGSRSRKQSRETPFRPFGGGNGMGNGAQPAATAPSTSRHAKSSSSSFRNSSPESESRKRALPNQVTPPVGVIGIGGSQRPVTLPPPVWGGLSQSIGFKGEALFAMSCVGALQVSSRADSDPGSAWTTVRVVDGRSVPADGPGGRSGGHGTMVTVSEMFARQPVRRLSQPPVAVAASLRRTVALMALGHPTVAFSLTDGESLTVQCDWPPARGVPERAREAFGFPEADTFVAAEASAGTGRSAVFVRVWMTPPGHAPSSAAAARPPRQVFLNGCPVEVPSIHREVAATCKRCIDTPVDTVRAVIAANRNIRGEGHHDAERILTVMRASSMMGGSGGGRTVGSGLPSRLQRQPPVPAYAMYVHADPRTFDIAVSPDKSTVNFGDRETVLNAVRAALRRAVVACNPGNALMLPDHRSNGDTTPNVNLGHRGLGVIRPGQSGARDAAGSSKDRKRSGTGAESTTPVGGNRGVGGGVGGVMNKKRGSTSANSGGGGSKKRMRSSCDQSDEGSDDGDSRRGCGSERLRRALDMFDSGVRVASTSALRSSQAVHRSAIPADDRNEEEGKAVEAEAQQRSVAGLNTQPQLQQPQSPPQPPAPANAATNGAQRPETPVQEPDDSQDNDPWSRAPMMELDPLLQSVATLHTYARDRSTHSRAPGILDATASLSHGAAAGRALPGQRVTMSRGTVRGLRVLDQVDNKYVLAVSGGVVYVVDQHAADERIQLERLEEEVLDWLSSPVGGGGGGGDGDCDADGDNSSTRGVRNDTVHSGDDSRNNSNAPRGVRVPETRGDRIVWSCTASRLDPPHEWLATEQEASLIDQHTEALGRWHYTVQRSAAASESTHGRVAMRTLTVPLLLGKALHPDTLRHFLATLSDTGGGARLVPDGIRRELAQRACHGAVRFGDSLTRAEASRLISRLSRTRLPFQCAHGRPSVIPIVDIPSVKATVTRATAGNRRPPPRLHSLGGIMKK